MDGDTDKVDGSNKGRRSNIYVEAAEWEVLDVSRLNYKAGAGSGVGVSVGRGGGGGILSSACWRPHLLYIFMRQHGTSRRAEKHVLQSFETNIVINPGSLSPKKKEGETIQAHYSGQNDEDYQMTTVHLYASKVLLLMLSLLK